MLNEVSNLRSDDIECFNLMSQPNFYIFCRERSIDWLIVSLLMMQFYLHVAADNHCLHNHNFLSNVGSELNFVFLVESVLHKIDLAAFAELIFAKLLFSWYKWGDFVGR